MPPKAGDLTAVADDFDHGPPYDTIRAARVLAYVWGWPIAAGEIDALRPGTLEHSAIVRQLRKLAN